MFYVQKTTNELDLSMFKKVSLKDRFLARFYDTIKCCLILGFVGMLFSFAFTLLAPLELSFPKFGELMSLIIALGWFLLRDGMRGGTSWGKERQDILVVCSDSFQDCTLFRSFLRNIISEVAAVILFLQFSNIISVSVAFGIILVVDIFRIIKSPGGRRIGDLIAKTQVIYLTDWIKYRETFKQQK